MPAYAGMTVQEVIPAQAGIQEPYTQLQTALIHGLAGNLLARLAQNVQHPDPQSLRLL
jgi:hypothetical protein